MRFGRVGLAWAVVGCGGFLAACSTTPVGDRPAVAVPPAWTAASGDAAVERDWWQGFGDPVLTRLVEEALRQNLDVRQAAARVAEARALASAQRGSALPALNLGAGAERSRSISDVLLKPYLATNHEIKFQASYEVDLWGRLGALTAAADAGSAASAATRDAVALSVSASVASGYFDLLAIDAQLALARRTLASRERSYTLTRSREARGYGSSLESAQAEAEWRATAQAIPQLQLAAHQQERGLDLLLGRVPGPIERGKPLLELTPRGLPDAGLPSELLRRRPDIAGAEWQVAAADAQLAAARAQLLPSIRLTASLGRVGSTVLNGDPFTVWSLGGSILAPIFNGGRLRSLAEASASRRDQALIGYEKAVLTSFAEVETQLDAFERQREQLALAEAQRVAVARSLHIATRRHEEGYASYLDELLAERSLFAVEQNILQLQARTLVAQVNVYRALGGGWTADDARRPTAAK